MKERKALAVLGTPMQNINACIKFSPTACQFHFGHPTAPPMPSFPTAHSPPFGLLSTSHSLHSTPFTDTSCIFTTSSSHHRLISPHHRNYGHSIPRIRESCRRLQETPSKAYRRRATPGKLPQPQASSPTIIIYTLQTKLSQAKLTYTALRIIQDRHRRGFRCGY